MGCLQSRLYAGHKSTNRLAQKPYSKGLNAASGYQPGCAAYRADAVQRRSVKVVWRKLVESPDQPIEQGVTQGG